MKNRKEDSANLSNFARDRTETFMQIFGMSFQENLIEAIISGKSLIFVKH